MKTNEKGKQIRLYIEAADEPLLERLCEATGLNVTTSMTILLSAGLRACAEAGNRLPLPLRFQIQSEPIEESPPKRTTALRK